MKKPSRATKSRVIHKSTAPTTTNGFVFKVLKAFNIQKGRSDYILEPMTFIKILIVLWVLSTIPALIHYIFITKGVIIWLTGN